MSLRSQLSRRARRSLGSRPCRHATAFPEDGMFVAAGSGVLLPVKWLWIKRFVEKRIDHKRWQLETCRSAQHRNGVPDGILFSILKRALLKRMECR